MAEPPSGTIAELVLRTISKKEIVGEGGERVFYRMSQIPGMLAAVPTNYILKRDVRDPFGPNTAEVHALLTSTSLSTPIMVEPFFYGLKPSTPGTPLAVIYHPHKHNNIPYVLFISEIKGKAFLHLSDSEIEDARSWPVEKFIPLMQQAKAITETRLAIDSTCGNVIQGEGVMTLIDLAPKASKERDNDFFTILSLFSLHLYETSREEKIALYEKLVQAAEVVGFGSQYTPKRLVDFSQEYIDRIHAIPRLEIDIYPSPFPQELTAIGKLAVTEPASGLPSFLKRIFNANCGREIK